MRVSLWSTLSQAILFLHLLITLFDCECNYKTRNHHHYCRLNSFILFLRKTNLMIILKKKKEGELIFKLYLFT